MDGKAIEGDSLDKLVKRAKSMWINDTYWLLMPYKLRDPGVTLSDGGMVREGTTTYDKLALSFDQVGETPGDHYWVYVNRANHRVENWDMVLEGDKPPPETWTWEGWEQKDGLWFPTAHRQGQPGDLHAQRRDGERVPARGVQGPLSASPTAARADARIPSASARSSSRIQGEGPSAGTPAHFLRLQGCDVGCRWCDTKYTLGRSRRAHERARRRAERGRGARRRAAAGGDRRRAARAPAARRAARAARSSAGRASRSRPAASRRRRSRTRASSTMCRPSCPRRRRAGPRPGRTPAAWAREPRATFKIVVGDDPDLDDALRLIAEHALPRERVMLMPEGLDRRGAARARAARWPRSASATGFRLSPRLHVWMWGARRGV